MWLGSVYMSSGLSTDCVYTTKYPQYPAPPLTGNITPLGVGGGGGHCLLECGYQLQAPFFEKGQPLVLPSPNLESPAKETA